MFLKQIPKVKSSNKFDRERTISDFLNDKRFRDCATPYVRASTTNVKLIKCVTEPVDAFNILIGTKKVKQDGTLFTPLSNMYEILRNDVRVRFFIDLNKVSDVEDNSIPEYFATIITAVTQFAKNKRNIKTVGITKHITFDNSRRSKINGKEKFIYHYRAYFPFLVFTDLSLMQSFSILLKTHIISNGILKSASDFNTDIYTPGTNIRVPMSVDISNAGNDIQFMADYKKKKIFTDSPIKTKELNFGFPYMKTEKDWEPKQITAIVDESMSHPSRMRFLSSNLTGMTSTAMSKFIEMKKLSKQYLSFMFAHMILDGCTDFQFKKSTGITITETPTPAPTIKIETPKPTPTPAKKRIVVPKLKITKPKSNKVNPKPKIAVPTDDFGQFLLMMHFWIIASYEKRKGKTIHVRKELFKHEHDRFVGNALGDTSFESSSIAIGKYLTEYGIETVFVTDKKLFGAKKEAVLIFPHDLFRSSFTDNYDYCKHMIEKYGPPVEKKLYDAYISQNM